MPTGYTAPVLNGITFNQFALGCARAFGALISMRDDPADAPIPEKFEPSDYHQRAKAAAEDRLAELQAMSPEQVSNAVIAQYQERESNRLEQLYRKRSEIAKYQEMLAKVQAWVPPTSEHQQFKDFMLEQLTESIRFDGNLSYYEKPSEMLGDAEWFSQAMAQATKDIAYHQEKHAEEVARVAGRSKWVAELRASLVVSNG